MASETAELRRAGSDEEGHLLPALARTCAELRAENEELRAALDRVKGVAEVMFASHDEDVRWWAGDLLGILGGEET